MFKSTTDRYQQGAICGLKRAKGSTWEYRYNVVESSKRGQALLIHSHRPHIEVRGRRTGGTSRHASDPAFLEALVDTVPYRIHTVLNDSGIQFAQLPKNLQGPTARFRGHSFDRLCFFHGIEHRLTWPNHPRTNGQVERMNRTIKDATINRHFLRRPSTVQRALDRLPPNIQLRLKTQ
jgi:transposase